MKDVSIVDRDLYNKIIKLATKIQIDDLPRYIISSEYRDSKKYKVYLESEIIK